MLQGFSKAADPTSPRRLFYTPWGYFSSYIKTSRAIIHGIADVLTLGLWEVVGTPIESLADGTEVKIEVCYDKENKVDFITVFKGEEYFNEENGTINQIKRLIIIQTTNYNQQDL